MEYNLDAIPIPNGSTIILDSIKVYEGVGGERAIGLDFISPDGKKGHADFPAKLIEDPGKTPNKEAARKDSRFYVVSSLPDWCKSPKKPTPYQIKAELSESTACSPNVKYTGSPAVTFGPTQVPSVKGNAKGVGGGVKSGSFLDKAETKEGSKSVRVNGNQQVRVDDNFYLNNRNTSGTVKDRAAQASEASEAAPAQQAAPASEGASGQPAPAAPGKAEPGAAEKSSGEKFDSVMTEANNYLEAFKDKVGEYAGALDDMTGGRLGDAASWVGEQVSKLDVPELKELSEWADRTLEEGADAAGGNRAMLLFFAIGKGAKDIVLPTSLLDFIPGSKAARAAKAEVNAAEAAGAHAVKPSAGSGAGAAAKAETPARGPSAGGEAGAGAKAETPAAEPGAGGEAGAGAKAESPPPGGKGARVGGGKRTPETHVPCFKPDGLPKRKWFELDRQLAGQAAGINEMTVDQYLKGRQLYESLGRTADPLVAQAARTNFWETTRYNMFNEYVNRGMPIPEASRVSGAVAEAAMKGMDALHNPDMFTGGADIIGDIGDASVNRSIGKQWTTAGDGYARRVDALDEAAAKVPEGERANTKMNAKLKRC